MARRQRRRPAPGGRAEPDVFIEEYQAQPIDFQTNGPQLFYGLRYHTHIVQPGEVATFHDQVGYWLWEPATCTVLLTLAIPRGQVALAGGRCAPDATAFEVRAERGSTEYGIASNAFLEADFTTTEFRMTVTVNPDGTWTYDENTRLVLPDRAAPFDHVDRNTLLRVAAPTPNPLALAASAVRHTCQVPSRRWSPHRHPPPLTDQTPGVRHEPSSSRTGAHHRSCLGPDR